MKSSAALFPLLSVIAYAEPAFVGTFSSKETGMLYAITPSQGASARWLKLGDGIEGYIVSEYHAKEEVIVLKKDGRNFPLKLKDSKVQQSEAPSIDATLIATARQLVARMDKWEGDVSYQVAKASDGSWNVFATKVVDGKKEIRRIRITPDGKATNYGKMTVQDN